jgi:hypothetical protein
MPRTRGWPDAQEAVGLGASRGLPQEEASIEGEWNSRSQVAVQGFEFGRLELRERFRGGGL